MTESVLVPSFSRVATWPLLLLSIVAITAAAEGADPWPTFRGPDGDGVAPSASDVPSEWSTGTNVAWRTEVPGSGWSSPVIGGGRVYLTSAIAVGGDAKSTESDGEKVDLDLCLLVFDEATGEPLARYPVMRQQADETPRIHAKNSHASPTPILDGDRIFVHFGYQGTACLDLQGKTLWVNRELQFKPTHGNGGSPILVEGNLVFTCDGDKQPRIVALDSETGKLVWQTPRPVSAKKTFSFCTPTVIEVDGQKQIVAPGSDCVLALDPLTGKTIWDVRYDGYSVVPKPIFHQGMVYISTSFDNSKMLAIRPNGKGIVTDSHVAWQSDKFVPKTPSMVAKDGAIYSVSDNGILCCIDAKTGDIIYRQRLGGNFSSSPLLVGDRLFVTSEEGLTTVVRCGREYELIAKNDLDERTLASAAVSGNALFLRTGDALYRIESR